jgi:predicted PurR-regulated permease PerM
MQLRKDLLLSDSKPIAWLQAIVYASAILYFGRDIFIPLSFAALVSFVLYPICAWLESKGLGRLTATLIAITLLLTAGLLVISLLIFQLRGFLEAWPDIQTKVLALYREISLSLNNVLAIVGGQKQDILSTLSDQSGGHVIGIMSNAITTSAFTMLMLILVPIYAILILLYRAYWVAILGRLFPSENSESLRKMISLTIKAYYNFIKGMAVVYLSVGILNSVGLMLLGVPHAILFGFIAAVLTFIPYAGIIAGSLLPMAMAWITFDSIWYPLGVVAIFTFVQYLEANIIFPWAVSSRLNVNTLVMLIAIFVGGLVWGMAGMILFVPFAGIAKLIADHNPRWKTISMILGTGKP